MAFFVAFYSYKGGVGRTLALANAAYALAARGKRVVLVDLDLEAPGLQEYREFALRKKDAKGFMEYAASYRKNGKCPAIKSYVHPCKESPGTGKLWLMPAGAVGGNYQEQLSNLPWGLLHPEKGTLPFLEGFRSALDEAFQPDYVLIDSRTGLSDIGGLSTHQLADMIVLVFNLTRAGLEGSVRTYRSFVSETSKAKFLQLVASPVPPLPPSGDSVVERRLAYAREHMPLGVAYGRTILRIDYNPAMALSEELAVRQPEVFPAAERYEELREAIQRANPREVFSVLEQARTFRSAGSLEDALDLLSAFTLENSGNAEGHLELGNFFFEAGRAKEAIPEFQTACKLAPTLALAHRRLGEALLAAGRADDALEALKNAEAQGDRGRETYQALARVHARRQETASELEARRKAMLAILRGAATDDRLPSLREIRRDFLEVLTRHPPYANFQAEAFWERVMGSLSLPLEKKRAILHSVAAGAMEPTGLRALSMSLEEESVSLERDLGPGAKALQRTVAEEVIDATDPDSLLKLRKGNRADAILLGFLAIQDERPEERSLGLLEEAVTIDPEAGHLWGLLGAATGFLADSASNTEKTILAEQSISALEKAVALKSSQRIRQSSLDRDFYNWGNALLLLAEMAEGDSQRKLLQDACLKYEEALRHKPDKHDAYTNWGSALAALAELADDDPKRHQRLEEACLKYEEALRHKPDQHQALVNWAHSLVQLSRTASSPIQEEYLRRALEKARLANEIHPGAGSYTLICALSLLGEVDEASDLLIAELKDRPDMRSHALSDPDLAPIWEARPDLRASIAAETEAKEPQPAG